MGRRRRTVFVVTCLCVACIVLEAAVTQWVALDGALNALRFRRLLFIDCAAVLAVVSLFRTLRILAVCFQTIISLFIFSYMHALGELPSMSTVVNGMGLFVEMSDPLSHTCTNPSWRH